MLGNVSDSVSITPSTIDAIMGMDSLSSEDIRRIDEVISYWCDPILIILTLLSYPIIVIYLFYKIYILLETLLPLAGLVLVSILRYFVVYHGLGFNIFTLRLGIGPFLPNSCQTMTAAMDTTSVYPCLEQKYIGLAKDLVNAESCFTILSSRLFWDLVVVTTLASPLVIYGLLSSLKRWWDCATCGGPNIEALLMIKLYVQTNPSEIGVWGRRDCGACRGEWVETEGVVKSEGLE
ncbi:hypothetical protein LTR86_003524 [Recurvomyces mirabilis]|nr:hypothetical protein LTR86_003524 [Recurvomyces mirabilis]